MARANVYIDGFNFYYGLKSRRWHRYGWCNLVNLAASESQGYDIAHVKYFTARDDQHRELIERQTQIWWKALRMLGVEIHQGYYQQNPAGAEVDPCENRRWREKQTDAKLVTELVFDAWDPENTFDRAVLISRDADFIPPVRRIASPPLNKRVLVLLPPAPEEGLGVWREVPSRHIVVKELRLEDIQRHVMPRVLAVGDQRVQKHDYWFSQEDIQMERAVRKASAAR